MSASAKTIEVGRRRGACRPGPRRPCRRAGPSRPAGSRPSRRPAAASGRAATMAAVPSVLPSSMTRTSMSSGQRRPPRAHPRAPRSPRRSQIPEQLVEPRPDPVGLVVRRQHDREARCGRGVGHLRQSTRHAPKRRMAAYAAPELSRRLRSRDGCQMFASRRRARLPRWRRRPDPTTPDIRCTRTTRGSVGSISKMRTSLGAASTARAIGLRPREVDSPVEGALRPRWDGPGIPSSSPEYDLTVRRRPRSFEGTPIGSRTGASSTSHSSGKTRSRSPVSEPLDPRTGRRLDPLAVAAREAAAPRSKPSGTSNS